MRRALAAAVVAALALPAAAAERAIRKETVVAAPVEAVYAAWTTSPGLESFFAPEAVVHAEPDAPYYVHFNPYARPGQRGADDMRVLALQENRMVSFTWNAPPHLPEARAQKTVVIVRTTAEGEARTKVELTHVGWGDGGEWDQAYDYFDRAWTAVLANLEKRFRDKPRDWSEFRAAMRKHEDGVRAAEAAGPRKELRVERLVAAPPAEVWRALATEEGLKRWAAPVVSLEMRNGGWLRAHYDKSKPLGSPGTTHLDILTVVDGELVTYKVHLNHHFPAKARREDAFLQQVVRLEPAPEGRTRLVSVMTGWGAGKEWEAAYAHFEQVNRMSYDQLAALFAPARAEPASKAR